MLGKEKVQVAHMFDYFSSAQNCQGNSEGDRCERCRAGFALDSRSNQCVRDGQYPSCKEHAESDPFAKLTKRIIVDPTEPVQPSYETGLRGSYYIDQRPYDGRGQSPMNIVLDGNRPEQRVPLQVLVRTFFSSDGCCLTVFASHCLE